MSVTASLFVCHSLTVCYSLTVCPSQSHCLSVTASLFVTVSLFVSLNVCQSCCLSVTVSLFVRHNLFLSPIANTVFISPGQPNQLRLRDGSNTSTSPFPPGIFLPYLPAVFHTDIPSRVGRSLPDSYHHTGSQGCEYTQHTTSRLPRNSGYINLHLLWCLFTIEGESKHGCTACNQIINS